VSIGTLLVLVLLIGFGVAIFPARRADLAEYHLMHGPNTDCPECAE
jgi:hypothetical protein